MKTPQICGVFLCLNPGYKIPIHISQIPIFAPPII